MNPNRNPESQISPGSRYYRPLEAALDRLNEILATIPGGVETSVLNELESLFIETYSFGLNYVPTRSATPTPPASRELSPRITPPNTLSTLARVSDEVRDGLPAPVRLNIPDGLHDTPESLGHMLPRRLFR